MISLVLLATLGLQDIKPPAPGYELVWHDEFDGEGIDATKWKPWALGKRRQAINDKEAAKLDGKGNVVISTRRVGDEIRSGGLWTHGLYEPKYGWIEARIKLQTQLGHWSAFWLNSDKMGRIIGDPAKAGVEIDVMEFHKKMAGGTQIQTNLHWDGYGDDHKSKGVKVDFEPSEDGFHVFAMEWLPRKKRFLMDGKETWVVKDEPISQVGEHLILSLEVGDWAGFISDAKLPDSMVVDYVRVWQKKP
jgi:beta-glucanase (GH16 family)